ncbi:BatA domain-containing protein [Bremerella sp. JC770]|uniref:BatA domain-containing protein n=1 Tax=Bremerella sp. JC770 TaxID=3232137 RepID=UPI003459917E
MFPYFVASGFAIAGAMLMAGPALIHLMNRNRYRTVHWAAMDFLLEAMQSNRRLLRIRDLLLMALRALALLLFGLALARPYFTSADSALPGTSKPPHAILVVDNSMSNSLESISGSALDASREQAKQFLEKLPSASQISVIALCGAQSRRISDPFTSRTDAADAIDKIVATDGPGELTHALNQARRLAEQTPSLSPYVVVFGDQQTSQWQRLARGNPPEEEMPVILVGTEASMPGNAWVEEFGLPDGMAEVGMPTRIVARVRYQGDEPRSNVAISFQVRDNEVETKFADFPEGDSVQTLAFDYVFDAMEVDPSRMSSIPLTVSIAGDALPADDSRSLVVPLVASTPVVFIDQWSDSEESPALGRLGETWILRQLLCPQTEASREEQHLIRPIHLSHREAEGEPLRAALREARLAVVAGIESPSVELVRMLRSYVEQGGQLAIAAGGDFDPHAWNDKAWQDGRGILPKPLEPTAVGQSLSEFSDDLQPFRISGKGLLDHSYFRLADLEETQLIDLYTDALFFKTVVPTDAEDTQKAPGNLPPQEDHWLSWTPPVSTIERTGDPAEGPPADIPATTIAQFDNGVQFVVERHVGAGRIVFFSSGISSEWSTLPSTNAVLIFDRVLRNQLASTFQRYNFSVGETALLPIPPGVGDSSIQLIAPDSGIVSSVSPRFLNEETRGVLIDNLDSAGVYWLSDREQSDASVDGSEGRAQFRMPISGTPTAWESQLARLDEEQFAGLNLPPQYRWQDSSAVVGGSGLPMSGHSWWQWLIMLVILLLIVEMTVAAMPSWLAWIVDRSSNSPSASSASS